MSIKIDVYLAPELGKSLTPEAFLGVVDALIRRDLVVPPYRVFLGKKGSAKGLSETAASRKAPSKPCQLAIPSQLANYYPPQDKAPPDGIKLVYEGDEVPALRSAIGEFDFLRKSVFVTFWGLNWNTETFRARGRAEVSHPGSVLFLSSPEELVFQGDYERFTPEDWQPERSRRERIACHQCAILVGNWGPNLEHVPGSVVEDFFRKQFGTPLQMVMKSS